MQGAGIHANDEHFFPDYIGVRDHIRGRGKKSSEYSMASVRGSGIERNWETQPDDNRRVKVGGNVYQSVDLSIRVVPQKNMEIHFPAVFRQEREYGKRPGVWRTSLSVFSIFFFFQKQIYGFFMGVCHPRGIKGLYFRPKNFIIFFRYRIL